MKLKKFLTMFLISVLVFPNISLRANRIGVIEKVENSKTLFSVDGTDFFNPYETTSVFIFNGKRNEKINPVVLGGYPFLPIREIFEMFGGTVSWKPDNSIEVIYKSDKYAFRLDSASIYKNDVLLNNQLVVKKVGSKIYFPAVLLSNYMGFKMRYDSPSIYYDGTLRFLPIVYLEYNNYENQNIFKNKEELTADLIPFSNITLKSGSPFINTNFPEQIPGNSFYETFANQTNISNCTARYFASHVNSTSEKINYIIRFENKTNTDSKIEIYYDLAKEAKEIYYQDMERKQIERFYENKIKGNKESIVLKKDESKDFVIKDISSSEFFAALMDLKVDGNILITSFVIPSKDTRPSNSFATPKVVYDYDYVTKTYESKPIEDWQKNYTTYSGVADAFEISAFGTIKASELQNSLVGFETGKTDTNLNELKSLNEILDINLVQPRGANNEIKKATWVLNLPYIEEHGIWLRNRPRNYGNLGNWNADYNISIKLVNDTDKAKTFSLNLFSELEAVVGVTIDSTFMAKSINNTITYDNLNRANKDGFAKISVHPETKLWKVKEFLVEPNQELRINYKYTLATNSYSGVYHLFDCK